MAGAVTPARLDRPGPQQLVLAGHWTARSLGRLPQALDALAADLPAAAWTADASAVEALDSAGAWLLHRLQQRLQAAGGTLALQGLQPQQARLLALVGSAAAATSLPAAGAAAGATGAAGADCPAQPAAQAAIGAGLVRLGRRCVALQAETLALLGFIGATALAAGGCIAQPSRWRWRAIAHEVDSAGVAALPIVGLLAFLLGVVVAYQATDPLRQYGATLFVVDLVGIAMLREFAPLITAIILAGRSGSAYAAQIGTMAVTEEIDALRTLGIAPLELLVLPKLIGLVIALPLLTVFADALGVFGGMVMARTQFGMGFGDFIDRFSVAVSPGTALVGVGKAPVFAAIIALIGCHQGLRTRGGADSVGRQTTRSVVQAIFGVIVADAVFSVVFSALDL